jgi:hypothetical protein
MLGAENPRDLISSKTDAFVPVSPSKLFVTASPSPAAKLPDASTSKFIAPAPAPVELQSLVGANRILLSVARSVGNDQSVAVDVKDKSSVVSG